MMTEQASAVLLGNRYRLVRQVGKGGMAYVYKAYDQMLERPVAVKLLKQDFSRDSGFRERFKQEAKSAANLSHPNIVTVHDFGIDPAGVYIVMEYISGPDLKSLIKEKGHYLYQDGLALMIQACAGLGYAHRAGIIHCDVKPHNMLISSDRRLKITDFGIARALSTIDNEFNPDVIWGSPQYFSPEQALGEVPTPSSDVYSLGVVMYELFTGHLPFEAETVAELIKMHQTQTPSSPRVYIPDIPDELELILFKLLAKEPSSRYRTADQLGHVLSMLQEKLGYIAASESPASTAINGIEETTQAAPPPLTLNDFSHPLKNRVDWKLIWLELFAILLVGGLIPFWLYIFLKLTSSIR